MQEACPSWTSTSSIAAKTLPEPSCSTLPPASLVTPRRLDLAIKCRYFKHLLHGGDPESELVYRWHILKRNGARIDAGLPTDWWKRSTDDYVSSAMQLAASMRYSGFLPLYAVPVDLDGELLGGAHRVACALALGLPEIPVTREQRRVWAPPWGEAWFIDNGMGEADIDRLRADMTRLAATQPISS